MASQVAATRSIPHLRMRGPPRPHCTHSDGDCVSRRVVLGTVAASTVVSPAKSALPFLSEPLLPTLFEEGVQINDPGVAWTWSADNRAMLLPAWMEGTWQVRSTFVKAGFPLGPRFVTKTLPGITKCSALAALPDVGASGVEYLQRFVKGGGGSGADGVIADRTFNIRSSVNAFLGYESVRRIDFEQRDPMRLAVVWATPRRDASEQSEDLRKAELFINNRRMEGMEGGGAALMERFRQVTQAVRQGSVGDYMSLSLIAPQPSGQLLVRQRVAAYLEPQDALYFDAQGRAAALYDYQHLYTLA